MPGTIKNIASSAIGKRALATFYLFFLVVLGLSGCAVPLQTNPSVVYDFGPASVSSVEAPGLRMPPLAMAAVQAPAALDSTAVLYRLTYVDARQLRPYSQARWSMAPAQLVEQRVRARLGQERAVLNPGEGATRVLQIELDEFSQVFEAPAQSAGLLRLRATLLQLTPAGASLVAQRNVLVQRPAPSADAPGGVRALTAATDAAADELVQWLAQLR
ncbi:MAG: PqiC family protein [Gammaproteobacteria bacterium]|nr:PqiC family protein [Gammaproteobacteria bacterium]MBU0785819.1 PqiC family protein [Gammaproteobacteria bacterium]MBU0815790.1 PqiC family protein [Gammaproteobacteria bacterium]MBU1787329.1 PqiC family protein [Gammaproteobacteria bacterium]